MPATTKLTPAMRQYMEAKKDLPEGTILLFRMGDFYELFFDDAKTAAPMMDIVLTKRGGVPMCGVPYHALQTYVGRLLEQGVKVAIAEQMEDPKLAKGLVKRAVVQVITPGTVLDSQVLSATKSNFLVALMADRGRIGLALLDFSTGDFRVAEIEEEDLETELHRLQPAECLISESLYKKWEGSEFPDGPRDIVWTAIEDWLFDREVSFDRLCRQFEVASLDGFGCRGLTLAICAAGAALQYAQTNLRRDAAHITSLQVYHTDACLVLDRISQRNLELVEPIFADAKNATLLSVLDHTITPMGGRMLREWVLRPLRDVVAINERLDVVGALVEAPMLLAELREALSAVRDLERTIVRVNVGSASGRDLLVLRNGLETVPDLKSILANIENAELVQRILGDLPELPEVTDLIARAIVDEPPNAIREGGVIREGFSEELDTLRAAATEGKNWIANFQIQEQERSGIKSLKVRFNKVFGYYIEVTKSNLDLVPEDYLRKQTLVNAERFITPELKEIEDKVLGAEEKSKALEYDLFQEVRNVVVQSTAQIQLISRALATTDALTSLAEAAGRHEYRRPQIVPEPVLDIRDGRHPVLDANMVEERFVPNDTMLDTGANQLAVITGPNMAGKSTYIRQVALLTLMAQMGSFIPAESATIGLTDRIFTRVGAADDISRGQSTFMVEMVETANILNNASAHSLIILDEIGRGTSTFDGLSLAWAVAEYLHDVPAVKARTLFATHYHELTELELTKDGVVNYNVAVREYGEQIIFLRKILPGTADKSYGIHVARLAGLPKTVIKRAGEVLSNLEANELGETGKPKLAQKSKPRSRRRKNDPDDDAPTGPQQLLLDL